MDMCVASLVVLADGKPLPPFSPDLDPKQVFQEVQSHPGEGLAWELFDESFFEWAEGAYTAHLHLWKDQFGISPDLVPYQKESYQARTEDQYLEAILEAYKVWADQKKEGLRGNDTALEALEGMENKLIWMYRGQLFRDWTTNICPSSGIPIICPTFYRDLQVILKEINEAVIKVSGPAWPSQQLAYKQLPGDRLV